MRRFKSVAVVLSVLILSVCFLFSGCTNKLDMPTGEVSSNGGNVVVIGDYIYFANTFVSSSSLSGNDNNISNVDNDGILRIKTENGKTVKDENGYIENYEQVYKKIAGYESSNMFVVGDYLYFTSPNTHKAQNTSEDRFNLSTLFRIKLDGTEFKEILTTETTAGVFYLDKVNNLYIFDNNKLLKLEIKDNTYNQTQILTDVEKVIFPTKFGEKIENLYYTQSLTTEDGVNEGVAGNKLKKLNIQSNESTLISQVSGVTIQLLKYENNILIYGKTNLNNDEVVFSNSFVGGFEAGEMQHTFIADETIISSICPIDSITNDNRHVFYKYNSKIYLDTEVLVNEDSSIAMVEGDYLYYTTTNGLYRISYRDKVVQTICEKENIKSTNFDFDGRYIYFFAYLDNNSTDTYYVLRADTKTAELGRINMEIISYALSEDLIEITEEE